MNARRRITRRGFSMVEMLVALGITALVLTATAMAFQSALQANEANIKFHDAVVAGRNTMEYILRTVRTAESISVQGSTPYPGDDPTILTGASLVVELPPEGEAETGDLVAFHWDEWEGEHPLRYYRNLGVGQAITTMLPAVQQMTFEREVALDLSGQAYTSRLTITITVADGDTYHTLSGSVAPRKSLKLSEEASGE